MPTLSIINIKASNALKRISSYNAAKIRTIFNLADMIFLMHVLYAA